MSMVFPNLIFFSEECTGKYRSETTTISFIRRGEGEIRQYVESENEKGGIYKLKDRKGR